MTRNVAWRNPQRLLLEGFTIVELLVVIAILGLLTAIILPAVQSSRESSRLLQCKNQMRQIGVALHDYESSHGFFPSRDYEFELDRYFGSMHFKGLAKCPSDPESSQAESSKSYVINYGTRLRINPHNGFVKAESSLGDKDVRPSDFTDGLSNTAAFSERLIGEFGYAKNEEELRADPLRYAWYANRSFLQDTAGEAAMAEDCRNPSTPAPWAIDPAGVAPLGYDHRLPPNTRACMVGPAPQDPDVLVFYFTFSTATSLHRNIVNVLIGDGSVRAVNSSIDTQVWRALGTRAGQEIIEGAF